MFKIEINRHSSGQRWSGAIGVALWTLLVIPSVSAAPLPGTVGAFANGQDVWAEFVEPDFPFFSSVLDARNPGVERSKDNLTPRGIILNLGHECWACFDPDLLRMSAHWRGQGVTPVSMAQGSYHVAGVKAPEGQDSLPQPVGQKWLMNGLYPGWQTGERVLTFDPRDPGTDPRESGRGPIGASAGGFRAIRLVSGGAGLEYDVAGVAVREWVTARMVAGEPVVQRRFHLDRASRDLWLILGQKSPGDAGRLQLVFTADQVDGRAVAELVAQPGDLLSVRVHASAGPIEFAVAMGKGSRVENWGETAADQAAVSVPARWPQVVTTRARLSTIPDAYVVDNIPLPVGNPWKRNVRLADLAFFPDGRAAAVTFDGDVWMISGLHHDLTEVTWRRFASGLHEPLGLCVRGNDLFVHDRNGIWRLRDTDGNGEADRHELFSDVFAQTAETREFAAGIRLAPDGSFVIAKGGQQGSTVGKHNGCVLRISPDGRSVTQLAHGLRQPFIGVHPKTGLVTASDQEGHYVPATPLHVIRDNQFYGFLPLILPKEQYPAPIADPLTWIPHSINASGAGQAWLVDARMGPLNEALIHFGYYRPEIFLVLLNQRAPKTQAAVVSVTRNLEFAPLAGALNPVDGQLYVVGFQIWGTAAQQISGLARLRCTGAPSLLPREVVPMDKGVLLRFDVALDPASARDPASFSAERWNYVRTANYGSPHFKLDGSKGQDPMTPSSAYLSKDGRSVFLGFPGMKPVMQMRLGWALATRDGVGFEQNAYFTPFELTRFEPAAEGFEPFTVDLAPRTAPARVASTPVTAAEGKRVSELMGCVACHSVDGSTIGKVGPTWKGVFGSQRVFADGSKTLANEAYLRESIREPALRVVKGFEKSDTGMPSYEGILSEAQVDALVLYIESLR